MRFDGDEVNDSHRGHNAPRNERRRETAGTALSLSIKPFPEDCLARLTEITEYDDVVRSRVSSRGNSALRRSLAPAPHATVHHSKGFLVGCRPLPSGRRGYFRCRRPLKRVACVPSPGSSWTPEDRPSGAGHCLLALGLSRFGYADCLLSQNKLLFLMIFFFCCVTFLFCI